MLRTSEAYALAKLNSFTFHSRTDCRKKGHKSKVHSRSRRYVKLGLVHKRIATMKIIQSFTLSRSTVGKKLKVKGTIQDKMQKASGMRMRAAKICNPTVKDGPCKECGSRLHSSKCRDCPVH